MAASCRSSNALPVWPGVVPKKRCGRGGRCLTWPALPASLCRVWHEPGGAAWEPIFVPRPGGKAEDDGCLLSTIMQPDGRRWARGAGGTEGDVKTAGVSWLPSCTATRAPLLLQRAAGAGRQDVAGGGARGAALLAAQRLPRLLCAIMRRGPAPSPTTVLCYNAQPAQPSECARAARMHSHARRINYG